MKLFDLKNSKTVIFAISLSALFEFLFVTYSSRFVSLISASSTGNLANAVQELKAIAIMFIVSALGASALKVFAISQINRYSYKRRAEYSTRIMEKLIYSEIDYSSKLPDSSKTQIINSEVDLLVNHLFLPILQIIYGVVTLILIIVALIYADQSYGMLGLLTLGTIYALIFIIIRRKVLSLGVLRLLLNEKRFTLTSIAFANIAKIKINKLEQQAVNGYFSCASGLASAQAKTSTISQVPRNFIEGAAFSIFGLSIIFFAGDVSGLIETVFVVAIASYRALPSAQSIFQSVTLVRYGRESLKKISRYLDFPHQEKLAHNLSFVSGLNGRVNFRHVTFKRGDKLFKVNDMSLDSGVVNVIWGVSGSGKTSFVQALLGLIELDSGSIEFQQAVGKFTKRVGYVSQTPIFFSGTVRENFEFFLGAIDTTIEAKALNLFRRLKIDTVKSLDFKLDQNGANLSGGQLKRLALVLELLHEPWLLVLDEVSSGLDSHAENLVMNLIDDYVNSGGFCFLITHNDKAKSQAKAVIEVNNGCVEKVV